MPRFLTLFFFGAALHASAAEIHSAGSGPWSAPGTWENGQKPAAGDVVLIRPGHRVTYDVSSETVIRAVHVGGTLSFARDQDTLLCTGLIRIAAGEECREEGFECHAPSPDYSLPEGGQRPALEVGTPEAPIPLEHRAVIRLTYVQGMDPESFPAIMSCGGRMDFHGAPMLRTWVKLGSSASRGSREIELAEPTGWRAGDRVVFPATEMSEFYQLRDGRRVIPSLLDDSETEEAEVLGADPRGILLKEPLKFKHQASGEFRGEVANLSRNVVVESADPKGHRGHTVYHRGSAGSISYAEFRHLGKKDVLGRYPIHFHLCADTMRGSSVVGASVWDSANRWVTIHGSNFIVVRDCVGYRSIGHGYFFEDGTEVNNVFDRNLAVQALMGKPLPLQVLNFDTNDAAGFWWANCLNAFTRNVAVDCEKFGYRFQMVKSPEFSPVLPVLQPNGKRRQVDVRTLPFIRFDGNEAHSQRRFALNLGGFHGQSETADLDRDGNVIDRAAYLGGDVQGVGPDYKHPFRIKDFLVWNSHWGFHSTAPNVSIKGFTAHDVNYVFWRSNAAGHDYIDLKFSDIHVSEFFNNWGASATREDLLRYVEPVDDAAPVTMITGWEWLADGRVKVSGVTVDDGQVAEVLVNGEKASITQGPACDWSHVLYAPEGKIDLVAGASDQLGNEEKNPHHLSLSRESVIQTSLPLAVSVKADAAMMVQPPAPAEVRESTVDAASLKWPLWDGTESVVDYAHRTNLAPVTTIDLQGTPLEMVLVPAGSYLMGSAGESGAAADESPQHRVVISKPFYLGKYELTQAQYQAVTGKNPSYYPAADKPVEQVTWGDTQAFLQKAGHALRLPIEAEWEFACRAGSTTAYSNGPDQSDLSAAGWWGRSAEVSYGNAPDGTTAVGKKQPNRFGLHDMHGNVYEWCSDFYAPDYYRHAPVMDPAGPSSGEERVLRGGSWEGAAESCRSANRNGFNGKSKGYLLGFRAAMDLP
ncbi:SUMF1/EgtB/PvdO family nonheme iron enzyme [Luteolibacter luteus]|uniref:SUMF1/EgtB/PvdO family nonheme iron enzyme n=1 Tax=Luteolibacter luteus TaxID=2728835 RepID=A0A858RNI4_9BACT|nr:SUMF1/EgtB/PvdO family nonheme iron enzyme [Luteolibacter luteus]QJE98986.1 SUMF1/EgtB/PvdO family nonheme iron enzyme [Luteolibacter luteus]